MPSVINRHGIPLGLPTLSTIQKILAFCGDSGKNANEEGDDERSFRGHRAALGTVAGCVISRALPVPKRTGKAA